MLSGQLLVGGHGTPPLGSIVVQLGRWALGLGSQLQVEASIYVARLVGSAVVSA